MDIRQIFYNKIENSRQNLINKVGRDIKKDNLGIIRIAKGFEPKFEVSERNSEILSELQLYFTGGNSKYDLNKGIWLHGNAGTGKTLLLEKIFKSYTSQILINNSYIVKHYTELISELYKSKFIELDKSINSPMFIDDVGVNQILVNLYGNEINFISLLIDYRYRSFKRGKLTHITTNLFPKQLKEIVDDRTISRMSEMFNIIEMSGNDYRRMELK